jgi:glycosyltransferase involved in cell wall biosynthesis
MKITISVPGRFHAFDMAKQLQKKFLLEQIITSYPASQAKKFGVEPSLVKSIVSKELFFRAYKKLLGVYPESHYLNEWFDIIASYKINFKSDIYVIWSGFGSHTIKQIRKKNPGAKIIIERGSTHISFQKEILLFAYSHFPELKPSLPNPKIIKKEITEYENSDYIAIPTQFVKQTFIEKEIPESKLMVTPYGVDLSSFTKKKFSSKKKLEILFTGNFCVRKGARTFIEILKIYNRNTDFHFNIVGSIEPGLVPYIKSFIDNGSLSYTPHVPQNQLNNYYHLADVFLFPSYEEGMAMVILQAMACGLCVIASPNSGAGMLIKDKENGFLYATEDVHGIVELLNELQCSEERLKYIGEKARQSIEKGYSWDEYGNRIIAFYKKILE